MFANAQGPAPATSMAFPDVCKTPTPAGPIPIPYPNVAMASTAVPSQVKVFVQATPAHNMMTQVPMSNGDNAGVAMGLVSQLVMGPCRHMKGSFTTMIGGAPATRMLDTTGQNGMAPNAVGTTLSPSQPKVLILAP
ncbi:MAG: DUF4150 domain-containing protein [Rhodothalassiaceae bacterium]